MKSTMKSTMPMHDAQGDLNTLLSAEEIRQDHKRHAAAVKHGKKKMKAIKSVADLKKVAMKKINKDSEPAEADGGSDDGYNDEGDEP